jgi:biopolymer transport protein ExbD
MKRWRAILGLGVVAIVAAAMVLRPVRTAIRLPTNVELDVQQDGSVEFGGTRFTDMARLRAALIDACAQKPRPMVHIRGDKAANLEQVGLVMSTAQKANCLR